MSQIGDDQDDKQALKIDKKSFFSLQKRLYALESQWSGREETLKEVFLPEGEVTDENGNTSFMVAVWSGKIATAQILWEAGAEVVHLNEDGNSVFHSMIRDINQIGAGRIASVLRLFQADQNLSQEYIAAQHKAKKSPGWLNNLMTYCPYQEIDQDGVASKDYETIIFFAMRHFSFDQIQAWTKKTAGHASPRSLVHQSIWQEMSAEVSKRDLWAKIQDALPVEPLAIKPTKKM